MRTINSFASLNSRRLPTPLDREQLRTLAPSIFADITDCFNHYALELRATAKRLKAIEHDAQKPDPLGC